MSDLRVCARDGVAVVVNRAGRLVHTDEIPKGVDPDHEVEAVSAEEYLRRRDSRSDLRQTATDMLLHHGTLHPLGECEWARRLQAAVRSA